MCWYNQELGSTSEVLARAVRGMSINSENLGAFRVFGSDGGARMLGAICVDRVSW
jgi:hypothetical protein